MVYGDDAKAPEVLESIINVIYPNGKLIEAEYEGEIVEALFSIENAIREAGLGPQAGMNELDRLADV